MTNYKSGFLRPMFYRRNRLLARVFHSKLFFLSVYFMQKSFKNKIRSFTSFTDLYSVFVPVDRNQF